MASIDRETVDAVTADLLRTAKQRYEYPTEPWQSLAPWTEARTVARCLCGDVAYMDRISEQFEREAIRRKVIDPCLSSLLFALLDWRERSVFGGLPDTIDPMPTEQDWNLDTVRDTLLMLGMYETEYEFSALSNLTEEPHILPGWTYRGLCELMALHLCRLQRIEAAKEEG